MTKPGAGSETSGGSGAALFLAPEVPYPLAGGGALRAASMLHYLALRYTVDAVFFREPGAPHPAQHLPSGLVRRLCVLDLPVHRRDLPARAWRNAVRLARGVPPLLDRFAGFEAEIARFLAGYRYDVAVVEHFWCAPYRDCLAEASGRTVLDLHNIESALHAGCARAEPFPQALAHALFERACRAWERRWLPRYDCLLTASEQDAERVRALSPGARVEVYRNALPPAPAPVRAEREVIAFSGNMEYHPNRTAVRFFAREVWPALRARHPGLVWRLIGKNEHAVRPLVAHDARIECTGAVPDAVAELARVRAAVVPLLAGSGTRLKILEAWAAATPVVSTRVGAEGLPALDGENILLADTPADFGAALERLLADAALSGRIGAAGRRVYETDFTWDTAWTFLNI